MISNKGKKTSRSWCFCPTIGSLGFGG